MTDASAAKPAEADASATAKPAEADGKADAKAEGKICMDIEKFVYPLTEEEQKAKDNIAKLRARLKTYCEDKENANSQYVREILAIDRCAVRWLFARGHDIEKAAQMFLDACKYRKEHKVDELLDAPYPKAALIKARYHHCWHRHDKFGRPIYIEQTGKLDIAKLQEVANPDEFMHYHLHTNEYFRRRLLTQASQRKGQRVDQICTIVNLEGLGRKHMSSAVYSVLNSIAKVDQLIYPELLGRMFIINAPMLFSIVWKMVRPWLEDRTKNKIDIIRGPGTEEMLKYIDAENLPAVMGGKCNCEGGCIENSPETKTYMSLAASGLEEFLKAEFKREQEAAATSAAASTSAAGDSKQDGAAAAGAAAGSAPVASLPAVEAGNSKSFGEEGSSSGSFAASSTDDGPAFHSD